jgi:hypothetical protein
MYRLSQEEIITVTKKETCLDNVGINQWENTATGVKKSANWHTQLRGVPLWLLSCYRE